MKALRRLLLFILLAGNCAGVDPKVALLGEWTNKSFRVERNVSGPDSLRSVFEVLPHEWPSKLKLSRIVTSFQEDGTYVSDHFTPSDSLLFAATGNWSVNGDSILFDQLSPRTSRYTLHVSVKGDSVRFTGLLDWDGDGISNDRYTGIQARETQE